MSKGSTWGHPRCILLIAVRGGYQEAAAVDRCGTDEGGAVDLLTDKLVVRGDRLVWRYHREPFDPQLEDAASGGFDCTLTAADEPICTSVP